MTTNLKALASTGAVVAMLGATASYAQDMGEVDTNQDGSVSQEEFAAGYGSGDAFGSWDRDQSGTVDEEEFASGTTAASEASGEDDWTEEDFAEWDADQSGDLSQEEIAGAVFILYDADQSGDLSEEEYSAYTEETAAMGSEG